MHSLCCCYQCLCSSAILPYFQLQQGEKEERKRCYFFPTAGKEESLLLFLVIILRSSLPPFPFLRSVVCVLSSRQPALPPSSLHASISSPDQRKEQKRERGVSVVEGTLMSLFFLHFGGFFFSNNFRGPFFHPSILFVLGSFPLSHLFYKSFSFLFSSLFLGWISFHHHHLARSSIAWVREEERGMP